MPALTGAVMGPAEAGSLNPNLSRDGDTVTAPVYPYNATDMPRAPSGARTYQPNVSVAAQRAVDGVRMDSYFEDFYFRVHVRPSAIALGSLASAQTRAVEVWSAYLEPNQLYSITATGADSIELSGPAAPPTTFGANEARQYNLSVTPNGPPTVAARFVFNFALGSGALSVTASRIVGWPIAPDWARPVVERLEWATDVLEAHGGHEQRVRLRQHPRRGIEYKLLIGGDRDRVRLEHLLLSWQARVYGVPVWTEAYLSPSAIAAGSTSIAVPTTDTSYAANGLVGLVRGPDMELAEIASVATGSITLKTATTRAWPAGTRIVPVLPARVQDELRIAHPAPQIVDATVRFSFEDEAALTAETPAVTYRGYAVLLAANNWADGVDVDYTRKLRMLDSVTGRRFADDLSGVAAVRRTRRRLMRSRTEVAQYKRWLAARAGRLSAFWLPSGQDDLLIVSPIASGDAAITVENRGYAASLPAAIGRRDIIITTTTGQRYMRRITGATENDAATETLAIDSALGVTLTPQQVQQVSFMVLARLAGDAVEIAWHTDEIAESQIGVTSVRDDL